LPPGITETTMRKQHALYPVAVAHGIGTARNRPNASPDCRKMPTDVEMFRRLVPR
jgi:hypothetical protein